MKTNESKELQYIISINKQLLSKSEAKISIFDRGFLFGDSIYEVTLTYNKVPFLLEEHLDRLWNSANALYMPIQFSREELKEEIHRGLTRLNLNRIYIRLIITRGEGLIGLDPDLATQQNLIIIFKELPPNPQEWYEKGVHMVIADIMRNPKKAIDPNIKSGNYLNNVLAMSQAKAKGAFDAIMLNHKGQVTEGTTNNIWIVQGEKVMTPPLKAGLLSGITRATLLKIGQKKGILMSESNFTADTLKNADEVFFTSSTKELVPVTKIDESPIGPGQPGPMTKRLHTLYQEFVQENILSYKK